MNELALFAGSGGGILGGQLLGWNTVGAVEIEEYPRKTLLQRQRDGILGKFPIWDDITTFDGRPWNGAVDIVSGGFPCQDISAAGKGEGIDGARSGLWGEMRRVVCEVSPRFVFVENSPMLTSRGLYRVLGDLAEMGYNARWCVLGADDAGAPHKRKRIWILGYSSMHGQPTAEERKGFNERSDNSEAGEIEASQFERPGTSGTNEEMGNTNQSDRRQRSPEQSKRTISYRSNKITWWDSDPAEIPDTDKFNDDHGGYGPSSVFGERSEPTEILGGEEFPNTDTERLQKCRISEEREQDLSDPTGGDRLSKEYTEFPRVNKRKPKGCESPIKPQLGRVAHGVANRVDRLKAIGNGQVPSTMALAFLTLSDGLM